MKVIEKRKMFCSICENVHDISLCEDYVKGTIKGEKVTYKEYFYMCDNYAKNNIFVSSKMMDENNLRAKDEYRKQKGLLTSQEIKEIRSKYKLSQAEFSLLLGWGEITITRYETKLIQDVTYDKLMRLADENAFFTLESLKENKDKFKKDRYEKIENDIKRVIFDTTLDYLTKQEIEAKYVNYEEKDIKNGNINIDIDKLESIIKYIAENYNNLYKVKLMKLLWYIDFIYYKQKQKSMTGLVYLHENLGALPIGNEEILKLKSLKVIEEEKLYGEEAQTCYHILPNEKFKTKNLTKEEKEIIDKVLNKFKDYTSKKLVDYMHKEEAYKQTVANQVIEYSWAKDISI